MSWQQWVYLVMTVVGMVTMAAKAGQPRPDYPTGGALAFALVFYALFAWFVLWSMS